MKILIPSPGLCDTCKEAFTVEGGLASIDNCNVPQRYCSALSIAIHFTGKKVCKKYNQKNQKNQKRIK